jgi:hypothetical protein
MPRSALNLILLVIFVSAARYVLWYFFNRSVENNELLKIIGAATAASVGYTVISDTAKNWFKTKAAKIFSAEITTKYLLLAIVLMVIPSLFVGRIDLLYKTSPNLPIKISSTLINTSSEGNTTRKATVGLILSKASLSVGRYTTSETYLPFVKTEIQIPYSVSTEYDMELQRIERQLTYAFFQFYESKYLASAKTIIAAQATETDKKESLTRLSLIEQILEFSIVGGDVSGARMDLLNRFHEEFANDGWTSTLDAAVAYSNGDYYKATQILSTNNDYNSKWPGALATEFFRSVCLLKNSRNADEHKRNELLAAALSGFKKAEDMATKEPDTGYRSHALASSIIFQAIHNFYVQDTPHAKVEFLRAANFASGALRARALNGAGYLEFVEGNLDKAEVNLLDALESDPIFAYALSNYGYVLMAKDQYETAVQFFEKNAKSAELRATSPRDVLLAELAIGHANEELKNAPSEISNYYSNVLKSSGHRDFAAVTPVDLRLAYQYTEMAEKIYLSNDYYGLEVFALALLSDLPSKNSLPMVT